MKFANNIDLNLNQLLNAVVQQLGSDPSPTQGRIWYNTATNKLMYRDNAGNRDITYLAQVLALRLDQFAVPTADLNLGGMKITSLADGTASGDAVNFGQLQSVLNGRSFKDAVRVATTANITLSGLQTIDGISVAAGERVLVKDQSTGSQNGIYVAASGAWSRAEDANTSAEVKAGMSVMVAEGTANADKIFTLTTDDPITLGTTALVFAQTGSGTTYTGGLGITITGSDIAVDTSEVPLKYSTNIGDGATTAIVVTHNLGTKDIIASVRKVSTDEVWIVDVTATTTNTATFTFATAPALNEFRVTIHA